MSAVFAPTPVEQQSYTQPSDGDNKPVASVTPFLQGLADGQATHSKVGFDWTKGSSTHNLARGAWSPAEQAWYAVAPGGSDAADVSYDGGRTWAALAPGVAGLALADAAAATAGINLGLIVLVASASRTIYFASLTSYATLVWSTQANALSAAPSASDSVSLTFTPLAVQARFIAVYRTGGALHIDSSQTGVAPWTAAVLPASWAAYAGAAAKPTVHAATTGRTMAWLYDDGASLYRIAFSTDGLTWTEATTIPAPAFVATTVSKPAHESVLDEWYCVAAKTAARTTQVLRSADGGVTWTDVGCATPDMALQDVIAINGILVGINDDGRVFRSVDRGVHWSLVVTNPITVAARPYLRKGDGQLAVWNSSDKTIFVTPRLGATGGTAQ